MMRDGFQIFTGDHELLLENLDFSLSLTSCFHRKQLS